MEHWDSALRQYSLEKGRARRTFSRDRPDKIIQLQVGVARGQHRGKARGFFLATPLFTRLFKMPVIAHDLEGSFAVDFFLQSPQRTFHWFAFF
jgi:hypothetical protein